MNEFQITTRPVKDGGRGLGGGDWGGIGVVFVDAGLLASTVQDKSTTTGTCDPGPGFTKHLTIKIGS